MFRRGRAGVAVLSAAMTFAAGAALAADGGASAPTAGAASAVTIAAPLQQGDRGPEVAALQRRLGVHADGAFGPRTAQALKRFQRRHGLQADGVLGPATAARLGLKVAREARSAPAVSPVLAAIAACESGGNPAAVSADGIYRGKYQFSVATWQAIGGSGDPAAAPESVQDRLAAALLAARGTAPWPNCA